MKSRFIVILAIVVLFTAGCEMNSGNTEQNFNTPRIVLITPHADNRYWDLIAKGIESGADKYGFSFEKKEPLLNCDNIDEQVKMVEKAIEAKADAIIIKGNSDSELLKVLEKARDRGIVVTLVDSDISNFQRDFYVGTDNFEAGEQLAKIIISEVGLDANIAIITAEDTSQNLQQRLDGFESICDQYHGVLITHVFDDQWSSAQAIRQMGIIINQYLEVNVIVSLEGYGTLSMNNYIKEKGETKLYLYGFDYDSEHYYENVKEKNFTGIMTQQPYQMGECCAENLYNIWEGKEVENNSFHIPTVFINSLNVDSFSEEGVQ